MTSEKDKLANRTPTQTDQQSKKREVKNIGDVDFEELIGTDRKELIGQDKNSEGDHPFNLSFVHSQIEDYPDLSDEENLNKLMTQKKKVGIAPSQDDASAIRSDSSFAD